MEERTWKTVEPWELRYIPDMPGHRTRAYNLGRRAYNLERKKKG